MALLPSTAARAKHHEVRIRLHLPLQVVEVHNLVHCREGDAHQMAKSVLTIWNYTVLSLLSLLSLYSLLSLLSILSTHYSLCSLHHMVQI